jgi:hypothetical protein
MGIHNLTLLKIGAADYGRFITDEVMEAGNAYPRLFGMFIFVIITHFIKVIPVIKNTNPDQICQHTVHNTAIIADSPPGLQAGPPH